MSEKYLPANGEDFMSFMEDFCILCIHDTGLYYPTCDLIARAMAHEVTDPEYPEEWVRNEDGYGKCTRFCP